MPRLLNNIPVLLLAAVIVAVLLALLGVGLLWAHYQSQRRAQHLLEPLAMYFEPYHKAILDGKFLPLPQERRYE